MLSKPRRGEAKDSARSSRLAQRWTINELLEGRMMLAAHVAGDPTVYSTIQAAVDACPTGGTVTVDPGNVSEQVVIGKSLNLKGAQAGVDARSNLRRSGTGETVWTGIVGADGAI